MGKALEMADGARTTGMDLTDFDDVMSAAREDAADLLGRWREAGRVDAVGKEVRAHLDTQSLATSIYHHALVHARRLGPEDDPGRLVDECPRCGEDIAVREAPEPVVDDE